MDLKKKVAAIVVTYNRKLLLQECVDAILNQTYLVDKLIIIDNASTDGTQELLECNGILSNPIVNYVQMKKNTGGAGGFYEGLKIVRSNPNLEWVWIMDDDTVPETDSLERLVRASSLLPNSSFFASCVKGMNGEPMNVPFLDERTTNNGYADWYFYLENKLVKIYKATFVSLLINCDAINQCGLPCKEYFIWGDDFEYTMRLTSFYGPAYLVGDSWVCHKRLNSKAVSIENENQRGRIRNYFYSYRNTMINKYIYEGWAGYIKQYLKYIVFAMKILKTDEGIRKFIIINKGLISSVANKKYFKKYVYDQCHIET